MRSGATVVFGTAARAAHAAAAATRRARGARRLEPDAHVGVEADAVHVVVERLAQAGAEEVVVGADGIVERDVVVRERDCRRRAQRDAVARGVEADRASARSR